MTTLSTLRLRMASWLLPPSLVFATTQPRIVIIRNTGQSRKNRRRWRHHTIVAGNTANRQSAVSGPREVRTPRPTHATARVTRTSQAGLAKAKDAIATSQPCYEVSGKSYGLTTRQIFGVEAAVDDPLRRTFYAIDIAVLIVPRRRKSVYRDAEIPKTRGDCLPHGRSGRGDACKRNRRIWFLDTSRQWTPRAPGAWKLRSRPGIFS